MKLQECLNVLRSKQFQLSVISEVEDTAACHFQSAISMNPSIRTLRDWKTAIEEQARQQTSALSVRFAYDFEFAIIKTCEDFGLPVLKKDEAESGHDFRLQTDDSGIVPFEVKTTQSANGFTGSTHSEGKGKAENYVLVSYELDLDKDIPIRALAFHGVVKSAHVAVLSGSEVSWAGSATNKNSSTTGKIPVSMLSEYRDSISLGQVSPAKVWCKLQREGLQKYRKRDRIVIRMEYLDREVAA